LGAETLLLPDEPFLQQAETASTAGVIRYRSRRDRLLNYYWLLLAERLLRRRLFAGMLWKIVAPPAPAG